MSTESALIECSKRMLSAFNAGDARAVAAHYTDDAVFMGPDGSQSRGRAAIETRLSGLLANGGVRLSVTPAASRTSGDLGFITGIYAIWSRATQTGRGSYVEIWSKLDGRWQIAFDIMNRAA